jgi:GT2 family glycosyltransferase
MNALESAFYLRRGRVDLPAACFNQYNVGVSPSSSNSSDSGSLAELNARLRALQRTFDIRGAELEDAHRHIVELEEKLSKLKQYRRELKSLREERRRLRKSPERRVGQLLLAPYRLPARLAKKVWRKFHPERLKYLPTEYQKWFEQHRASTQDLQRMRDEARTFGSRPLISIVTPVFDTPVQWLAEAVNSVLAQVYENWELLLVDDGSTDPELLRMLPRLAARDRRIVLSLSEHGGISAASNHGLAAARGEWVAFLDHDDILEPDALFQNVRLLQENPDLDLIYSDEDKITQQSFGVPMLKPDWSPDFFLSCNYLCHLIFLRREMISEVGGFRSAFDGSQDYDLLLRVIERTQRIAHIPRVLYHWRRSEASSAVSVRQKPGQLEASRRAIEDHLKRRGEQCHVSVDWRTHAFRIRREVSEERKITIIIVDRHQREFLQQCVESLTSKTDYANYEVLIVQADEHPQTPVGGSHFPHRRLNLSGITGYSAARNSAIDQTDAPWVLFLDDRIEVIEPQWLTYMAEHVQRSEVGAVGARLLNRKGNIEHAGIVVGVNGIAQSAFRGFPADHQGVNRQLQIVRNYSAVSGACMLVRREVFERAGGFDERLPSRLADVDLCLKIRRAGYLIIYTPFAKLYWHETQPDKLDDSAQTIMREQWADVLEHDPYYNPNLSREHADFSLKVTPE